MLNFYELLNFELLSLHLFMRQYIVQCIAFGWSMKNHHKLFQGIPIVQSGQVKSGEKYQTDIGFSAVKNGQKQRRDSKPIARGNKPKWLRAKMPLGSGYSNTRKIVSEHRLSTVCEESMCPNIGECWNAGTATIMVMG